MDDMISRQTVLDALDEIESEVADGMGYQYDKWRDYFIDLPSAQPEHTETHSCDCQHTETHDLVSRLSIRRFPERECNDPGVGGAYRQGWNDAIQTIVEDEPQRMRGRWIEPTEDNDYWECPVCHDTYELDVDVTPQDVRLFFCPNCGADMREGQDETN